MKLFLSLILISIVTLKLHTQTNQILPLKKIDNVLLGITPLDSLPIVFVENSVDLQTYTAIVNEKLPNLTLCNTGECKTELLLVYNVFHDRHNLLYGTIELDCRRWASISETGFSGFFSVWTARNSIIVNEHNTLDIKGVLNRYVRDLVDNFAQDYNKENQN